MHSRSITRYRAIFRWTDGIFEQLHIEIDKQTDWCFGGLHLGNQLSLVDPGQLLDCLKFKLCVLCASVVFHAFRIAGKPRQINHRGTESTEEQSEYEATEAILGQLHVEIGKATPNRLSIAHEVGTSRIRDHRGLTENLTFSKSSLLVVRA